MKNNPSVETDNLVRDGDFPNGSTHWDMVNEGSKQTSIEDGNLKVSGHGSASQTIQLTPLTQYVAMANTKTTAQGTGYLKVISDSSTGIAGIHNFLSWKTLNVPFTTTATQHAVTIKLSTDNEVCFFDNVVVIEAEVESDLELIKNGDFANGAASWTKETNRPESVVIIENEQCKVANGGHADQAVEVVSGSTYLITFTGKASYSGQGNLQVLALGQPTRSISVVESEATQLSLPYHAKTDTVTVSLFGSSGEIIFDNVSMKKQAG